MVEHHQVLDLHRGVLLRRDRYRDAAGRCTTVALQQFQSMADGHVAALALTITPENWSGELLISSTVTDRSAPIGCSPAPQAPQQWVSVNASNLDAQTLLLEVITTQSQVTIATATRTVVTPEDRITDHRSQRTSYGLIGQSILHVSAGVPVSVEKVATVVCSRDRAISTASLEAAQRIQAIGSFTDLLTDHEQAWADVWDRFHIEIDTSANSSRQLPLNLHQFHVLQNVAPINPDVDAGVPARGLHGTGYQGHIFWDELFV